MHAFVITNDQTPMTNSPDILIVTPEKSIGIDEIRTINHFLAKKPIQSDKNRVYIKDAHLMTLFAQNALLKILEEPPGNSEVYLVTDQSDMLLPTILSRCQSLNSPNTQNSQNTPINPVGINLETLTTREQALAFLDGVELFLHQNPKSPINYDQISQCRKYLKANCNVKLCLNLLSS